MNTNTNARRYRSDPIADIRTVPTVDDVTRACACDVCGTEPNDGIVRYDWGTGNWMFDCPECGHVTTVAVIGYDVAAMDGAR